MLHILRLILNGYVFFWHPNKHKSNYVTALLQIYNSMANRRGKKTKDEKKETGLWYEYRCLKLYQNHLWCYKIFLKSQHMIKSWVETNNYFYYQLIRQLFSRFINSYDLKNVKSLWSSPSQSPSWNWPSQQKQLQLLCDIWHKVAFSRSNANWHVRTNADIITCHVFSMWTHDRISNSEQQDVRGSIPKEQSDSPLEHPTVKFPGWTDCWQIVTY